MNNRALDTDAEQELVAALRRWYEARNVGRPDPLEETATDLALFDAYKKALIAVPVIKDASLIDRGETK